MVMETRKQILPSPSCEVTVTTDADSVLATRSGNEHVSHKEPRTSQLRRLWVLKLLFLKSTCGRTDLLFSA